MNGSRPIEQISLSDFLSYGSRVGISLQSLNVLIGPNGSGKSNLIEALAVLRATATNLQSALREGGGVGEYVRKSGRYAQSFSIGTSVASVSWSDNDIEECSILYAIEIVRVGQGARVGSEATREANDDHAIGNEKELYSLTRSGAIIYQRDPDTGTGVARPIKPGDLSRDQSILSQRRDPELYPEITYLGDLFGSIAIFREWTFGGRMNSRAPQPTDLPTDFLLPDASNLALVLHDMLQRSTTRKKLIDYLQRFYSAAQHISTKIQGGTVQLFIEESEDVLVPATRLSDGTLRYLSLLAILCHPTPPPIVCIEEPELGLHPDIMPTIAELLLDASQRTQLIVTTHSDALVSALSEVPECIVVCESSEDGTELRRLDKDALAEWLSRYSLGEIWRMGEIGGTRW